MFMFKKIWTFLANLEWQWSLFERFSFLFIISGFAIPAWATKVTGLFVEYAPLSWVLAGFAGLTAAVLLLALYAWARRQILKTKYDELLIRSSGAIDPMDKVFERKRIYLNDFILPSGQVLEGKSFIECEIIGPCNLFMIAGNSINDPRGPITDGVILEPHKAINNAHGIQNGSFRGCNFHKITFLFSESEIDKVKNLNWINWVSKMPRDTERLLEELD